MQTLRFCFFCQALSSFSLRGGRRFDDLPGIQWCLLFRSCACSDLDPVVPIARATGPRRLLHLGGGPLEARTDVVGLDLDRAPLLALLALPRALLEPSGHNDTRPACE